MNTGNINVANAGEKLKIVDYRCFFALEGVCRGFDKLCEVVGRNVFAGFGFGDVFVVSVNKFVVTRCNGNGFAAVIGNAEILNACKVAFL